MYLCAHTNGTTNEHVTCKCGEEEGENKQQTRRLLITEKTATHNKHLTTIQNNGGTGKVADACIAMVEKHRQQVFPDNTKHTTIDYNMNQFNFFYTLLLFCFCFCFCL